MKKEVLSFIKDIAPGEELTLSERIKDGGRIEQVNVRFYSGVERALHVRPYILHDGRKQQDIITYVNGTEVYLSGDDDTIKLPCSIDVNYDDEFKVWARNTGGYTYTLYCHVIVSYLPEGDL